MVGLEVSGSHHSQLPYAASQITEVFLPQEYQVMSHPYKVVWLLEQPGYITPIDDLMVGLMWLHHCHIRNYVGVTAHTTDTTLLPGYLHA